MSPILPSRLNSEVTCLQPIFGQFHSILVPLTGGERREVDLSSRRLFLTERVGGKKLKIN